MPVSKKQRFEIFKRDSFACQYCGRTPPNAVLECDHIIPVSKGGIDDDENLITSCFDCNRGKANFPLTELPLSAQEAIQDKRERVEQMRLFNEFLMEQREHENKTIEEIGSQWFELCRRPRQRKKNYVFGRAREASVRRFLKSLPVAEILDAVGSAHSKIPVNGYDDDDERTWKYFCGICWGKIKDAN